MPTAFTPAAAETIVFANALKIDYRELVDGDAVTHSGETVGDVLDSLRSVSILRVYRKRVDDGALGLVESFLEPCAYVLEDALITADKNSFRPDLLEVADLFPEGSPQPAWVDLLRSRMFYVLSNGRDYVRMYVPGPMPAAAYSRHLGVLRHVLNWVYESSGEQTLTVDVHAYHNNMNRTRLRLSTTRYRFSMSKPIGTPPGRKAMDLAGLDEFFKKGLTIEGAAIDDNGQLVLLGSNRDLAPTLEGEPVSLSDLAVAYRATFYGGKNKAYMSLDRSPYPEEVNVNFGGRLQDTRIGWVTLRCDMRFKTIAGSADPYHGSPLADAIRKVCVDFETEDERWLGHPKGRTVVSEETRFWFYPDAIAISTADAGRQMRIESPRWTAAAERETAQGSQGLLSKETPPWTAQTMEHFNKNYDCFAEMFPEVRELDEVGRLLAVAGWLWDRHEDNEPLLDVDALLSVELPAASTPRTKPQMLALGFYGRGKEARPIVIDRSDLAERMIQERHLPRSDADVRNTPDHQGLYQKRHNEMEERLGELAQQVFLGDADLRNLAAPGLYTAIAGGLDLDVRARILSARRMSAEWRARVGRVLREQGSDLVEVAGTPYRWGRSVPPGAVMETAHLTGLKKMPHGLELWKPSGLKVAGQPLWRADVPAAGRRVFVAGESPDRQVAVFHSGPLRPTDTASARTIRFADNGEPTHFAIHERGRTMHYELTKDGEVWVARKRSGPTVDVESDVILAAGAARASHLPEEVWNVLWEGTLVDAVEPLGDGRIGVLTRVKPGKSERQLMIVKNDKIVATLRGESALEPLKAQTRDRVRSASDGQHIFMCVERGKAQTVRLQFGSQTIEISLAELKASLEDPHKPCAALDELFGDSGGVRDYIVCRDAFTRRPERFGGSLHEGHVEDPVQFAAQLQQRYPNQRIYLDDETDLAKLRLQRMGVIRSKADIGLIVHNLQDHGIRRDIQSRFRQAGVRVIEVESEGIPVPQVIMLSGDNSQQLHDLLYGLGERGQLKGRTLVLLTCGQEGNAQLFHELLRKYDANGILLFPERIDSVAAKRVLTNCLDILDALESQRGEKHPAMLLREAAQRFLDSGEGSQRLQNEVQRLLKGILQISERPATRQELLQACG